MEQPQAAQPTTPLSSTQLQLDLFSLVSPTTTGQVANRLIAHFRDVRLSF